MFLSRVVLSKQPSVQALNALLNPPQSGARSDAHHRLLWTLFADHTDRKRDFLWREERKGVFMVLSEREPVATDLFGEVSIKPFAPALEAGDQLLFALRANATRSKRNQGRVDVVMDALHQLPPDERAKSRMDCAQAEGAAWLARQGGRCGFDMQDCLVTDYNTHALPTHRGPRSRQPQFGILDLQGQITVTDPAIFVQSVGAGFGRAKAFGCGLMLLRRS